MKKTNKKKLEEFIRVDHAGERGAIKIYEGQLLALNTIVKNDDLKQIIGEMKKHEEEHSNFFENEIEKRNIKPTKLLPLWDLLGLGLGFGSTILGKKAFFPSIVEPNPRPNPSKSHNGSNFVGFIFLFSISFSKKFECSSSCFFISPIICFKSSFFTIVFKASS